MSYDISLFRPSEGEPIVDAYMRLCEVESIDDINPGPIVPEIEELKQRAAQELLRTLPTLARFEFDYAALASSQQIDMQEARRRWRHIELNDEELGLQVTISDHNVSITLPYCHEGPQAARAFDTLRTCIAVLCECLGYRAYDPQLDREIDPASPQDFSVAANRYHSTGESAASAFQALAPRKPWWKFW